MLWSPTHSNGSPDGPQHETVCGEQRLASIPKWCHHVRSTQHLDCKSRDVSAHGFFRKLKPCDRVVQCFAQKANISNFCTSMDYDVLQWKLPTFKSTYGWLGAIRQLPKHITGSHHCTKYIPMTEPWSCLEGMGGQCPVRHAAARGIKAERCWSPNARQHYRWFSSGTSSNIRWFPGPHCRHLLICNLPTKRTIDTATLGWFWKAKQMPCFAAMGCRDSKEQFLLCRSDHKVVMGQISNFQ